MPVLVAGFVLCCWCQLPAWSVGAGLMAVLTVPVLVASLRYCYRSQLPAKSHCQLPAWYIAARASCRLDAGASCRLRVVLLVSAAGLVCWCRSQ
ncbi:hypothetical protein PR002_g32387 [Phytophthora rubi]|uniref:Uncharacterized protein n=1 Tax=Phytophthora rubi TaxID=129364 RepID=A0A6A3G918_9STRA|nr:hypothetical protein PR002_g32387 [Phytophthora rubi]